MNEFTCRELQSDEEILAAFPLMSVLRDRIRRDTFVAEVRRQQSDGYELVGAYSDGHLVALAGVRRTHTLARGEHLFVDDLITVDFARGRGHGTALLRWLARRALAGGVPRMYLDARDSAQNFYAQIGFAFLTSVPCWMEVAQLAGTASGVREHDSWARAGAGDASRQGNSTATVPPSTERSR